MVPGQFSAGDLYRVPGCQWRTGAGVRWPGCAKEKPFLPTARSQPAKASLTKKDAKARMKEIKKLLLAI
jgi:hypothetical protein